MAERSAVRIGMLSPDPLRLSGTQAVLGEWIEVVALSATETLRHPEIDLILIYEPTLELLLEMLVAFRRARPGLRLIVLGDVVSEETIERIIAGGAKGYVAHTATAEELQLAVEVVLDGSVWAPRRVLARLVDTRPTNEKTRDLVFTPRERQVLSLLAAGYTNRDTAQHLGVKLDTVKSQVARLLRKVNVRNRVELAMFAVERHVIRPAKP